MRTIKITMEPLSLNFAVSCKVVNFLYSRTDAKQDDFVGVLHCDFLQEQSISYIQVQINLLISDLRRQKLG